MEQLGGSCQEQRAKRNSFRVSSPSAALLWPRSEIGVLLTGWFIERHFHYRTWFETQQEAILPFASLMVCRGPQAGPIGGAQESVSVPATGGAPWPTRPMGSPSVRQSVLSAPDEVSRDRDGWLPNIAFREEARFSRPLSGMEAGRPADVRASPDIEGAQPERSAEKGRGETQFLLMPVERPVRV